MKKIAVILWLGFYASLGAAIPVTAKTTTSSSKTSEVVLDRDTTLSELNELAYELIKQGQYDQAFKYSEQARRIAVYQNDNHHLARALTNLGSSYFYLSQHENALRLYNSAYDIARSNNDFPGISRALNNIGAVYVALENYTDATNVFQKSYAAEKESQLAKLQTLVNLMHASSLGRIYPDFVKYTEQLEQEIPKVKDAFTIAYYFQNLGEVAVFNGDLPLAETYFKKALKISEDEGFQTLRIENLLDLAEAALVQGDTINALNRVDDILAVTNKDNLNKSHFAKAYEILYRVYKMESQFEQALASLESHNRYANDLRELKVRQLAEIARIERQTQEQIDNLSTAEGQNIKLQQQLQDYKTWFWLSLLLTLVLVAALISLLVAKKNT